MAPETWLQALDTFTPAQFACLSKDYYIFIGTGMRNPLQVKAITAPIRDRCGNETYAKAIPLLSSIVESMQRIPLHLLQIIDKVVIGMFCLKYIINKWKSQKLKTK